MISRHHGLLAAGVLLLAPGGLSTGALSQTLGPSDSLPRYEDATDIILTDENLLIVQLIIERVATAGVIEIYQHEGGYFVPLGQVCVSLDFPIAVRAAEGTATGWFIRENRIFSLDLAAGEVVVEGRIKAIPAGMARSYQDEIYVDASLFSAWFPLDLELDYSELNLILQPREPIPLLARLARETFRRQLRRVHRPPKSYEIIEAPRGVIGLPFSDIDLGYDFDRTAPVRHNRAYSFRSHGDLGPLTLETFLSGSSEQSPSHLRLKGERKDAGGRVLGALRATSVSCGDINSVSFPLVLRRSLGRGVTVSNAPLARPDQFDTKTFIGETQPGWEVEIYRNGVLWDFQTVGSDGRYEFIEVPILYGHNVFRIVSYGPQGQLRQEAHSLLIDSSFLPPGTFNYEISVDEKSQTVFGVDEDRRPMQHARGTRATLHGEYGFGNTVTGGLGFAHTPLEDGRFHTYGSLIARAGMRGVLANSVFAYDFSEGGWATELVVHAEVRDVSMRAQQRFFSDFVSETVRATSLRYRAQSQIAVDGRARGPLPSVLTYGFRGQHERLEADRTITSVESRLASSVAGLGLGSNLRWQTDDYGGYSQRLADGSLSLRGRYRLVLVRGTLGYDLEPAVRLESVGFSGQKKLKRELSLRLDLRQSFVGKDLTTGSLALNRQFRTILLSSVVSMDSDGGFVIGAQVSFSVGRDPRGRRWVFRRDAFGSRGAASLLGFLDSDYDGVFDETEEVVSGVGFLSDGRRFPDDGRPPVFLTGVEPYLPSSIEIDETTLEDPLLIPSVEGFTVISRPGNVVELDFPLVLTKEIDGTVFLRRDGETVTAPGIELLLIDEEGDVAFTTRSEFDGFFLFDRLRPGTFMLRVSSRDLERHHAISGPERIITVGPHDEVISGMDLVIVSE